MARATLLLLVSSLATYGGSVPLEPGQPGGPWTDQEMGIVKQKVCDLGQKECFHFI